MYYYLCINLYTGMLIAAAYQLSFAYSIKRTIFSSLLCNIEKNIPLNIIFFKRITKEKGIIFDLSKYKYRSS